MFNRYRLFFHFTHTKLGIMKCYRITTDNPRSSRLNHGDIKTSQNVFFFLRFCHIIDWHKAYSKGNEFIPNNKRRWFRNAHTRASAVRL
jgi:hypothetical protein